MAAASSSQLAQNLDLCQNESTCVMQPFWLLKSWLGECILAKQKMKNGKRKLKIDLRQNGCTYVLAWRMQPFWQNRKWKTKIYLCQNESTYVMQPFWPHLAFCIFGSGNTKSGDCMEFTPCAFYSSSFQI